MSSTDHRAVLANIKTFPQLLAYLRDEMEWPIDRIEIDELMFDYTAEELGIDAKNAPKIEEIKRLRPLSAKQPWGIFFIKFAPKRLPVVALRRILGQVVLKKRASSKSADDRAWAADDLLFISNYGEGESRQISFAHFSQPHEKRDMPTLKVLGWDNLDTPLHLDSVAKELTEHLSWPQDDENVSAWREQWRSAFTLGYREGINTSKQLSIALAKLARAIRDRIRTALAIETEKGPLTKLMSAFRESLVHELKPGDFADMYAQTIAYGLLSARITDPTSKTADDFARHMRTNPFLKELMETFLHVGGRRGRAGEVAIDFDELGVNDVVELLDAAKMDSVVADFGDRNPLEDPVIHFYESFLKEYDPSEKKKRGVFYTPRPVVSYIVRSVDELLRTEFGLEDGLADVTSWGEMVKRHHDLAIPNGVSRDQPFVQILDPATGTGTFLVEVIDIIHSTLAEKWKKQGQGEKDIAALWNEYVPEYILKRLHGYELLMAPYAIAHLKIGLKLHETGYHFGTDERARVFLTNTLEAPAFQFQISAMPALAHEAQAVSDIKRRSRFTVVIGNPPYSLWSQNLSAAAREIVAPYRMVDGLAIKERGALQFEKILQDDYVKFFRISQRQIDDSGAGILGLVANHAFVDNPTLRGMRFSLLGSFKMILCLDLHGSSSKKECSPDGSPDQNVFDIKQGVAIFIGMKPPIQAPATTRSGDLWGSRSVKYSALHQSTVSGAILGDFAPRAPDFVFKRRDEGYSDEYSVWWKLTEIFENGSMGIVTARDHIAIAFDDAKLLDLATEFRDSPLSDHEIIKKLDIPVKKGWDASKARALLRQEKHLKLHIRSIDYRPFDQRRIFYHRSLVWGMSWPTMQHLADRDNVGLAAVRRIESGTFRHVFASKRLVGHHFVALKEVTYFFPLWLYPAGGSLSAREARSPNFRREFSSAVLRQLRSAGRERTPEDVFCYVYGVLHSASYRKRYGELLKSEFPRVPLTFNVDLFDDLARFGAELVALHLMESVPTLDSYRGPINPKVEGVRWSDDTVWIDGAATSKGDPGTIGFRGIPEEAWKFVVGGYQVCEKWLKDRKGRALSDDDIAHYQKIVVAVSETIRLVKKVDEAIKAHGGWPAAFQTGEVHSAEQLIPFRIVAQPATHDRYLTCVPLVPLKAAAGQFGDPQHVVYDEWEWVEVTTNHRLRPGMFVAQVTGRSMEPQIPDGGWCLFASPVTGTRQGKTVLVQLRDATDPDTGERYTVKRYESEKVETDGSWRHARITLEPLNPEFQPIVLTDDDDGVLQVVAEFLEVLTAPPADSPFKQDIEEGESAKPLVKKRTSHESDMHQSLLGLVAESPSEKDQRRTDADQLERAPAKPAGEDSHPASRRDLLDQLEVEDVLAIIRDVVKTADPLPREDAIKAIATHLGAERVGARIRDFIEGHLNTASRRYIIETRDGGLVACTKSIDDYHRDFLKTALKAVVGRTWTDEDEAIRAATRYLGFRRTGPKIERAFKSAINGLLRQDELERDGRALRRRTQ